jgi:hypothetical protein
MVVLLFAVSLPTAVLASLNGYQAVTGRRLSKSPSRRDDATMRRQSIIAAILLGGLTLMAWLLGAIIASTTPG